MQDPFYDTGSDFDFDKTKDQPPNASHDVTAFRYWRRHPAMVFAHLA